MAGSFGCRAVCGPLVLRWRAARLQVSERDGSEVEVLVHIVRQVIERQAQRPGGLVFASAQQRAQQVEVAAEGSQFCGGFTQGNDVLNSAGTACQHGYAGH